MTTTVKNIQDNLVSTIQGINGTPTYTNTVEESWVISRSENVSSMTSDPFIEVVRGDQAFQKHPSNRQLTNCSYTIEFKTLNLTQTEVDTWLVDIITAITADITRGGYAFETFPTLINHSGETIENFRVYRINIECLAEIAFGTL